MELKDELRGQLLTCCLASSSLDLKVAACSFIDAMGLIGLVKGTPSSDVKQQ